MDSFLDRYRNAVILALVLFIQFLGLAVQIKRSSDEGQTRLIRIWAVAAITPFEKAVVHSQHWIHSGWTDYLYLRGVRRENEDLKHQIDQMRIEQVRLVEDAHQARRIQSLLAFKEQFISKTVAAQVIGTSGSELSRTIYIDRGSNDGVKRDMAVITPDGIVGKVLNVYGSTSQVLEITDQSSGVGALLVKSRLKGTVKGTPSGETTLEHIMADEKVEVGEEVVTSGGDLIFPKGLPIGTVQSAKLGRDTFLSLRIRPHADLNRLEEVLVITEVQLKPPDTTDLGPIRAIDILSERLPSVPQKTEPQPSDPAAQGAGQAAPGAAPLTAKPKSATPDTAKPGPTENPVKKPQGN